MDAKKVSGIVDSYYKAREARLAADRTAAKLKEKETELKDSLIALLKNNALSTAGGKVGKVALHTKDKPVASDWTKIEAYIKDHDAFDLFQRRLTESAVILRWEDGIEIPGIGKFPVDTLSVSKA